MEAGVEVADNYAPSGDLLLVVDNVYIRVLRASDQFRVPSRRQIHKLHTSCERGGDCGGYQRAGAGSHRQEEDASDSVHRVWTVLHRYTVHS